MSKIICDVCGTVYPDTAAQCPICGCAKLDNAQVVESEGVEETETNAGGYTYVKGGRFSKANVRKRNKAAAVQPVVVPKEPDDDDDDEIEEEEDEQIAVEEEDKPRSNRGLAITAIVLLLAIIAVVIYIFLRFFAPAGITPAGGQTASQPAQSVATVPATTETVPPDTSIHCTALILSDQKINFTEVDQHWILDATAEPADTTDKIVFTSSNDAIVTVSQDGRVTAVATGDAIITVSCGDIIAQCDVRCLIVGVNPPEESQITLPPADEETEPPVETVPEETIDDGVPIGAKMQVLFYGDTREDNDVSLSTGSVVDVTLEDYDGNEAAITWVSDNPGICKVDGSTFKAVSPGYVEVRTTYRGVEYVCIIRVY